jgi:hypothetical protein
MPSWRSIASKASFTSSSPTRFVTSDSRSSSPRVEVCVADAAGPEPDEDLALAGWTQLDILDDERMGELLENGGADPHGGAP